MSKITERNTDQATAETWGAVIISPTDDVVVGTFSTWTVTFTVGAYAMDVGGGLKIGTRRQAAWHNNCGDLSRNFLGGLSLTGRLSP